MTDTAAENASNVTNFESSQDESAQDTNQTADVGGVAGQRLQSFLERIERLEEEKAAFAEDIKEVYAEAKGVGFDAKVMRKLISLRKMDTEKRHEEEELLDLYKSAVGMM